MDFSFLIPMREFKWPQLLGLSKCSCRHLYCVSNVFDILYAYMSVMGLTFSPISFVNFLLLLFNYSCPNFAPVALPYPVQPPSPAPSVSPHTVIHVHASFIHVPLLESLLGIWEVGFEFHDVKTPAQR